MPYLQDAYAGYEGPIIKDINSKEMLVLARNIVLGAGPPTPFSEGVCENLNKFLFARKPCVYALHGRERRLDVP